MNIELQLLQAATTKINSLYSVIDSLTLKYEEAKQRVLEDQSKLYMLEAEMERIRRDRAVWMGIFLASQLVWVWWR